jgi:type VI secretion system secreted protein Hcp
MAYQFFVYIKGKKQGAFKAESIKEKRKDKWIEGFGFQYEVKSPRDLATGQASGKRQHLPVTFVKEWGAATPQIFTALVTNEQLPEVQFEFIKTNPNGEEYVFHTIKLTDATISTVRQYTADTGAEGASSAKHDSAAGSKELEAVSFTFRKIEMENKDGKTMAVDDWAVSM